MNTFGQTRSRLSWVPALAAIVLAFLLAHSLHALDPAKSISQYVQSTWNSKAGLPQNSVHAIAQTKDGFIWMGTEEGFVLFDGVQFKVYNTRNTRSLPSDYIQCLAAGKDGSLWVGTDSGLIHFASSTELSRSTSTEGALSNSFTTKDGLAGVIIKTIHEDPEGTIWVGTATGLSRIRGGRVEDGYAQIAGAAVNSIVTDASRRTWIGTDKGLFEIDHGQLIDWNRRAGFHPEIAALAPDSDGSLWIGTIGHGLIHFRDGHQLPVPVMRWNEIGALLFDRDGELWISFQRHGIGRLFHGKLSVYEKSNGLPSSRVTQALFEDVEGSLWVGLLDAGAVQLRDGKFSVFGTKEGLAGNYVGNILQSRDGTMWIGSDSNGLNHLLSNGVVENWNQTRGLPNQAIYSILETRDGDLWVGFRSGDVAQIHHGQVRVFQDPHALHVSVNAIFEDRARNLWIGSYGGGIARFRNGRFEHVTTVGRIPAITQSPDGAIWWASDGEGVERLFNGDRRRFTTADGLPSNHAMCIYADAAGDVWVGTASGGLSRIRDGNVVSWTPDQGLPESTVGSVIEDNQGYLWAGGDAGIYRFSKHALNTSSPARIGDYRLYGSSDGLRSRETIYGGMPSSWKDQTGRLWFATIAGAAEVDPEHMKINTAVPPVWIESVTFDRRSKPVQNGLKLGPGANNLEIGFTSPSFVAPLNVRFRYRLLGFDRDWIDAGARRRAWYTNLAPGQYTFTVQAENSDGIWNTVGDSFSFVLRPPITRTPLAYAAYLLAILLAAWGVLALRTRALVRRHQELSRIVAERTAQLEQEKLALEAARQELHARATYDSLTGLFNRAAIIDHLSREIYRANRDKTPLGVLIVDLDFFKQVNDRYGHLSGDDVISEAAGRLRRAMRKYDLGGRYGGEEFLILFPGWNPDLAPSRIDDLLESIRSRPFLSDKFQIRLTCSIGVFRAAGTDILTVVNGSVGIGTAAPGTPLEISSDGAAFTADSGTYGNLFLARGKTTYAGHGLNFLAGSSADGIFTTFTGDALTFGTRLAPTNYERMRITSAGNVGIGTTAPGAKLEVNGTALIDGTLTVGTGGIVFPNGGGTQTVAYTGVTCGGDYAESVDVTGDRTKYEPGDVLVIDPNVSGKFLKSAEPYSTAVTGIYSTKPGTVGRRQATPKTDIEVPMAMVGIVPTKVIAENGPIHRGDLLVSSSEVGYAMKGTDRSRMLGAVIGKALDNLESGKGIIEVAVILQ